MREDDVKGGTPEEHDAGGPSPGILKLIREVVLATPSPNDPPKPADFNTACLLETYPGHSAADVHFEGRATDVYLFTTNPAEKRAGEWLFDWCVKNCRVYQIQGVIYDDRQWFSEKGEVIRGGHKPIAATATQKALHWNHVHIELNGDGAALAATPSSTSSTSPTGQWKVQAGGRWTWIYNFDAGGRVTWRDPLNGLNGAGKWKQIGGIISIDWSPSGSNDSWNWPPTAGEATGTADVEGEGCFVITATRM